jgi:phage terminase small subunit
MAALKNRRHERFAQLLAALKPSHEAYLDAGYPQGSSYKANARRLAQDEGVIARVAEIQERVAEYTALDAAWIKQRVARIADVEIACEDVRASDVIAASHLLAKMTPGAIVPTKVEASGADGDAIEVNVDARSLARTILGIIREASADAPPDAQPDMDTETEPQE